MMKRLIYISLISFLAVFSSLNAQPLKKAEAIKHLQDNNLEDARKAIDIAVINSQTTKEADTWYYRAFIYNEYYKNKDGDNPFSQFRTAVGNSCKKCIELDQTSEKEWATECRKIYDILGNRYYNDGVGKFQKNSFKDAYSLFVESIEIMDYLNPGKVDPQIIFLAGYSAFNNADFLNAKKYLLEAKSKGLNTFEMYFYIAKTYWALGERDQAFAILVEGNEKHPDKKQLVELHLKYLQETGEVVEKEHVLIKAIKLDPQNVDYYILLAIEYEKFAEKFIGEPNYDIYMDKAKQYYEKAIEIDPNERLANYNLGLLYYNSGVTKANNLGTDADILEIFRVQDEVTKLFKEALPYMQKSFEIDPKRKDTIIALDNIYTALNNPEKAKYYRDLLKTL